MLATDIYKASYSQIHTQVFHFANTVTADAAPITVLPFSTKDNTVACLHVLSRRENIQLNSFALTFCSAVLLSDEIRAKTI